MNEKNQAVYNAVTDAIETDLCRETTWQPSPSKGGVMATDSVIYCAIRDSIVKAIEKDISKENRSAIFNAIKEGVREAMLQNRGINND